MAIVELALDALLVHIGGHAVVDVQQGDGLAGDAGADVLGQRAVDVHLAGGTDAHGGQAAVDIAGHEAELGLEGRPALVGHDHVLGSALVGLDPIQQGQLILGQLGQDAGIAVALAQLVLHLLDLGGDAGIVGVLVIGLQQVQLGVFLHVDAQLEQRRDGRVAGQEVEGTGTEGDDLQVLQAQDGAGDGHEVDDLVGAVLGVAHGIFGNVRLDAGELQVIGSVQHAAIGVAAVAGQHAHVLLGGGDVHHRAAKQLGDGGLGTLGAEVAQENDQGIDAGLLDLLIGLHHVGVDAALDDGLTLVDVKVLFLQLGHDGLAALFGEGDREAVAADREDAHFDLRDVVHRYLLLGILLVNFNCVVTLTTIY